MSTVNLGDQQAVTDAIASQKQITGSYNTYAGECVSTQLRDEFLCILKDEHNIQTDLFNEMQSRGWYKTQPAQQQMIDETRNKYQSAAN